MEFSHGNTMFFKVQVDKTFLSLSDWQEVFRDSFCNLNSASTSKKKDAWAMAFTPSPTSVNSNSNFSLIDSISDITTLDMSDENNQPALNEEDFPSRPSLEKEGSLNSSMITIIVSPPSRHASLHCFSGVIFYRSTTPNFVSIPTSSKENRRH